MSVLGQLILAFRVRIYVGTEGDYGVSDSKLLPAAHAAGVHAALVDQQGLQALPRSFEGPPPRREQPQR
jgi:hypothetical protein